MSMTFREAGENEVGVLTEMSRDAFLSDVEFSGEPGGPNGYDDYDFHLAYQKAGCLYSMLDGENIVGGAILKENGDSLYVYRIFISRREFRKGYGLRMMQLIEEHFPEKKVFRLDTPEWNVRTNSFYQKCGYTAVGREHIPEFDLIVYEKKKDL